MRLPRHPNSIGYDISEVPIFTQRPDADSGAFEKVSQFDGKNRLVVFQRAGKFPLVMNEGLSVARIYERWNRETWQIGFSIAFLCGMNLVLIGWLIRILQRSVHLQDVLAREANTDVLTGLCNRRRFDDIFKSEWLRALRSQRQISILMIDADQFKPYNDRYGHQAGDEALVAISSALKQGARRSGEIAARYGGEEFIVLLPDTSVAKAVDLAERLRITIANLRIRRNQHVPTVSIGVGSAVPNINERPDELIMMADRALYIAKQCGRNRVEIAAPPLVEIDPEAEVPGSIFCQVSDAEHAAIN